MSNWTKEDQEDALFEFEQDLKSSTTKFETKIATRERELFIALAGIDDVESWMEEVKTIAGVILEGGHSDGCNRVKNPYKIGCSCAYEIADALFPKQKENE